MSEAYAAGPWRCEVQYCLDVQQHRHSYKDMVERLRAKAAEVERNHSDYVKMADMWHDALRQAESQLTACRERVKKLEAVVERRGTMLERYLQEKEGIARLKPEEPAKKCVCEPEKYDHSHAFDCPAKEAK